MLIDSLSSTPLFIDTVQGQLISIGGTESHSGNVNIGNDPVSVGNGVGFFLTAPANQQPHCVTLADVINVLATFGLTA